MGIIDVKALGNALFTLPLVLGFDEPSNSSASAEAGSRELIDQITTPPGLDLRRHGGAHASGSGWGKKRNNSNFVYLVALITMAAALGHVVDGVA